MCALLDAPTNRGQGFLAAGHVCTIMGPPPPPPPPPLIHIITN